MWNKKITDGPISRLKMTEESVSETESTLIGNYTI